MSGKKSRVIFYSKHDLSADRNLIIAEELLRNPRSVEITINDLFEYHHIKLYFDNGLFLSSWTDAEKIEFKNLVNEKWNAIRSFFLIIHEDDIIEHLEILEYNYKASFWELFDYFQVYKRLIEGQFIEVLNKFSRHITYILPLRNTVTKFDQEIRRFLLDYKDAAELLLARIEEKQKFNTVGYCFPKSLTLADRENIITNYLDSEEANLNYVRLIEKSKDSPDLKLSPKVRLKAKKKSLELNNQIFEHGHVWKEGIEVAISMNQEKPVK